MQDYKLILHNSVLKLIVHVGLKYVVKLNKIRKKKETKLSISAKIKLLSRKVSQRQKNLLF